MRFRRLIEFSFERLLLIYKQNCTCFNFLRSAYILKTVLKEIFTSTKFLSPSLKELPPEFIHIDSNEELRPERKAETH